MEEINSEEQIALAKINFYSEINEIIIPETYDSFIEKIGKMLNINSELNSLLNYSYIDKNNKKVCINSDDSYEIFLEDIEEIAGDIFINIEFKNNSNIDIDACIKSFVQFKENNNIIDKKIIIAENKTENNNNNMNNDTDSDNHYNDNNKNNIEENKDDDSNNIKEENVLLKQEEKEIFVDKNYKENNYNFNGNEISFPIICSECEQCPIINVLYYCLICEKPICQDCEEKTSINHPHGFYKIQTKEQYNNLYKKYCKKKNANQSLIRGFINDLSISYNLFFNNDKIRIPQKIRRDHESNLNNINNNQNKQLNNVPKKIIG